MINKISDIENDDLRSMALEVNAAYRKREDYFNADHTEMYDKHGSSGSVIFSLNYKLLYAEYQLKFQKFNSSYVDCYNSAITTELVKDLLNTKNQ